MNVTNCRSCGRLFNVLSNEKICPDCRKKLEDKFQQVKKYLEENPADEVLVLYEMSSFAQADQLNKLMK